MIDTSPEALRKEAEYLNHCVNHDLLPIVEGAAKMLCALAAEKEGAQPWSEEEAVKLAHRAGFAGTYWTMGPHELAHMLNMIGARASQPAAVPPKDERKAAEASYIKHAFDYARAPIGSRDWTLYLAGWQDRSIRPAAEPTREMLDAAVDATGAGRDMSWAGRTPQMLFRQAYRVMTDTALCARPAMPAQPAYSPEGVPFKPETWPTDADGDAPSLCNVCGCPNRYGERHSACGAKVLQPAAEPQCPRCAECGPYLKEDETPLQRIERDHRDSLALMRLLAAEKTKNEALTSAQTGVSGATEAAEPQAPAAVAYELATMARLLEAADILFAHHCRDCTAWNWLDDNRAARARYEASKKGGA